MCVTQISGLLIMLNIIVFVSLTFVYSLSPKVRLRLIVIKLMIIKFSDYFYADCTYFAQTVHVIIIDITYSNMYLYLIFHLFVNHGLTAVRILMKFCTYLSHRYRQRPPSSLYESTFNTVI